MIRNLRYVYFLMFLIITLFVSCTDNPEEKIVGKWVEVKWEYEDYEIKELKEHDNQSIRHHLTERWEFNPDETFVIKKKGGEVISGKWSILGRGHVLKLRYNNAEGTEVYDIKELNSEELILNIDIGMEIKGIARLFFTKVITPT